MEHKTYKIFDADDFARLTKGIKVAQCMRTDTSVETKDDSELLSKLEDLSVSEKLFCSFCNTSFEDSAQQRQHYKLDWHRYNLKKKLADKKAVTEEKFSQLADLDDVSSISGSESESDEETDTDTPTSESKTVGARKQPHFVIASRHAKVFFENEDGKIFSVYRCLLHGKKDVPERDELFVPLALKTVTSTKWAIIMLGGGHFAAGIFEGREVIAHKTFHCYTVRKGQGGTQSARDNRSGSSHPKSAGASLRRYNEAALLQHVQEITATWASDLAACDLIFYRASGHNAGVLFGGRNPPFVKTDVRLRTLPFPSRRATFSEVKRVHDLLAALEVYGPADEFKTSFPQSPRRKPISGPTDASNDTSRDGAVAEPNVTATEGPENPVPKRDRVPRRDMDRARERTSPVRHLPDIVAHLAMSSPSGSEEEEEEPGFMIDEQVEMNFADDLREFDDTVPGGLTNRGRKKPKAPRKKKPKEKVVVDKRPEMVALRGDLLKACNLGDHESLERSLSCVVVDGVPTHDDLLTCLNESVDGEGNKLLHVAARGGHWGLLRLLMESGSDPSIKNKKGQPPYVSSLDKETRNTFRRFLAEFPDKYDYDKSQIPGGLTDDILKEQAEKKRAMNKLKRDRIKQKKKEDDQRKAEQSEKERFLQLTDREKRALAAERRLLSDAARGGGPKVVVSRCFLCAADISGKVPFEYDIHRFCSIVCLKSHRMMNKP